MASGAGARRTLRRPAPVTAKRSGRIDRRSRTARAEGRNGREALLDAALEVCAERGYELASVDEIAMRAGYSKGALYWHFATKDDLFHALYEERIDRPWRETIALAESAGPEQDMAAETNLRFADLIQSQREMVLVANEYWAQAVRDPEVRKTFAERQRSFRAALGQALAARLEHLGAPPLEMDPEAMATAFIAIGLGLSQQKLIDAECVPDDLYGEILALIYMGHVARAHARSNTSAE
jgi:AcrR family transcriptional regulator